MGEVLQFPNRIQQAEVESFDYLSIAVGAGMILATKTTELTLCPPILSDELIDCPDVSDDPREYAPQFLTFNANKTLWLRPTVQQARRDGEELHASRRQQVFEGNFTDIPLDVDAIGTAEKVAKIAKIYGVGSPEHVEAKGGLFKDYARKLAEASRNNTWENFEMTIQRYEPQIDDLLADGLPVGHMINNGITPVALAEELDLRFNDKVAYAVTKEIITTPDLPPTAMLNLKPCPDYAHESLKNNPKSAHGGYSPAIDKLMVNLDFFNPKAKEIYHFQFGVSGKKITPTVMQKFLTKMRIVNDDKPMSRTEIHGTLGVLQGENLPTIDFVMSMLDQLAGEESNENIFLGEVVPEDHPKDYQIIFTEAELRQQQQVGLTNELVKYVEKLEADKVDHAIATQLVEKFIQDALLKVAEKNPELAEAIFDKPTAERFHKAQELKAQGRTDEAAQMIDYARKNAPAAGSCGAGSCGLESGANLPQHILNLLQAQAGDIIVIDTERPCNSCGEKKVVYAYNENKVNKLCTNCLAFESTETSSAE